MRDLPPELWYTILSLACTDGGTTSCALSLVSRRVREATAPYRYHSVALRGWNSIRSFDASVVKPSECGTVFVRHLFIATLPFSNDGYMGSLFRTRFAAPSMEDPRDSGSELEVDDAIQSSRWKAPEDPAEGISLLSRILSAAGPSLWTLSAFGLPEMPTPVVLPQLRDLILHHDERCAHGDNLTKLPCPFLIPLPELRRLHLLGESASSLCSNLVAEAQHMSTLRYSRPGHNVGAPLTALRSLEGLDVDNDLDKLPVGLKRILIQPSPAYFKCGNGARFAHQNTVLKIRGALVDSPMLDIVELRSRAYWRPLTVQEQLDEWKDVLVGVEGPWNEEATPSLRNWSQRSRHALT